MASLASILSLFALLAVGVEAAMAEPADADPANGAPRCVVQSPASDRQAQFGMGVYFEQDSVLPWLGRWGGDQNYTMGLAFPFTGQWIHRKNLDIALRGLDCLTGVLRAHNAQLVESDPDKYQDFSLVLGHTAFTPRELQRSDPIYDDRPYASLLYLSAGRLTVNPYSRRALRSELTVGMLGLRIGESVQTWIHTGRRQKKGPDAVTPYDPAGWPLQISDGGEPTAKYTIGLARAANESEFHDVSVAGEASVGYYTNVAAGATVRVGWLRSPFWAHNSNPLSGANQRLRLEAAADDGDTVDAKRARKTVEFAGFASGRLRVVGYNALLQGQFRNSPVTFNSAEISRVVLEGEAGVSIGLKRCSALLTFARRSAEFTLGQARAHTFGGVHVLCGGGVRAASTR